MLRRRRIAAFAAHVRTPELNAMIAIAVERIEDAQLHGAEFVA